MQGYALLCVGFPSSDVEVETQDEDEVMCTTLTVYFWEPLIALCMLSKCIANKSRADCYIMCLKFLVIGASKCVFNHMYLNLVFFCICKPLFIWIKNNLNLLACAGVLASIRKIFCSRTNCKPTASENFVNINMWQVVVEDKG